MISVLGEGDSPVIIFPNWSLFSSSVILACAANLIKLAAQWKNGRCERFHLTVKAEVFDRIDLLDVNHVQELGMEYQAHYNSSRPHQALAGLKPERKNSEQNLILISMPAQFSKTPVAGGLITEYSMAV